MHPAEQFLQALDAIATKFLFVGINQAGQLHTYYTAWDEKLLTGLNNNGYDIYFTVNKTIASKRTLKQFKEVRALWQEDDSEGVAEIPTFPSSAVIQTSPGHFHRYWFTTDAAPFDLWEAAQNEMCARYGSDPQAKDLARILRVPGFINWKRGCKVELISLNTDQPVLPLQELCMHLFGSSVAEKVTKRPKDAPSDGNKLEEWIRQIQSGEHLHGPIRNLMLIYANKGVDKALNKATCLGLIQLSPDEAKKAQALRDLDSMIAATYKKVEAEQEDEPAPTFKEDIPRGRKVATIDWPPGVMGGLAQAVYNYSVLPNKTVSIVTALGFIAGIAGRKYNVSKTGTNLYVTLLMNTGMGKDVIQKFCHRVLNDSLVYGDTGKKFIGASYYTSAKALRNDLLEKPCLMLILTEAGLANKTDAGDKNSLLRLMLDAYSKSGQHDVVLAEGYSSKDNCNAEIQAPSVTIIHESTPVTFKETIAKRNSFQSGEFARNWLFEVVEPRPYDNRQHGILNFSDDLQSKLLCLLHSCYEVQQAGPPDNVIEVATPDVYYAFSDAVTDRINARVTDGDNDEAATITRAALKVLKVAALLAILDSQPVERDLMAEIDSVPVITQEQWDWAVSLFEYEQSILPRMLKAEVQMDTPLKAACNIVKRLLTSDEPIFHSDNFKSVLKFRHKGVFTESPFKQLADKNKAIRSMSVAGNGTPISGSKRMLKYMVDEGLLVRLSPEQIARLGDKGKGTAKTVYYKVTQELQKTLDTLSEV